MSTRPPFSSQRRQTLSVFLTAFHLVVAASVATATVHVVPDQFPNVQPAIDFAASGDTVLIRAGTYVDSLTLSGKDLVLLGEAGPGLTILTTNLTARILDVGVGVTSATLIAGLRFHEGQAASGGAIRITAGASPTIRNCWFTNNIAYLPGGYSDGGALSVSDTSAVMIEGCEFRDNHAQVRFDGSLAKGGAMSAVNSSVVIRETLFQSNGAQGLPEGGEGGALYLFEAPTLIESCSFFSNSGLDGPLVSHNNDLTIRDCVFARNSTGFGAAAVYWRGFCYDCELHVSGSVFYDNSGFFPGVIWARGRGVISHNTIAYNRASGIEAQAIVGNLIIDHNIVSNNEYTGIVCPMFYEPDSVLISCNDVWNNAQGDYSSECAGHPQLGGNISANPLFCTGPARDFRIRNDSPCAPDAGDCGLIGALGVACEPVHVQSAASAGIEEFTLEPIHPNPSTIPIECQFQVGKSTELALEIYDDDGTPVRCCRRRNVRSRATHTGLVGSRILRGHAVRPGVYLAVLQTKDRRRTRHFVVVH